MDMQTTGSHLCHGVLNRRIARLTLVVASFLLVIGFVTSCKPKSAAQSVNSSGYFQTPFQDESQFIVEAIVSDLAQQIFYAEFHQLPAPDDFLVTATEKPGSP